MKRLLYIAEESSSHFKSARLDVDVVCAGERDYRNAQLSSLVRNEIPLADIRSQLHDEHIGDNLHPNEAGARLIADTVFDVLAEVHVHRNSWYSNSSMR